MSNLVDALEEVKRQFEQDKGTFALFACFKPDDSMAQWEVIVSAPWAPRHDQTILRSLIAAIDDKLRPEDRLTIARVVVVEPSDDDVQRINERFPELSAPHEIHREEHFGYFVEIGYILASHDYWRFLKEPFVEKAYPSNPEFNFFTRDGDLHIGVWWKLGSDASRPNKFSRRIVIRIAREALEDYIYVDNPQRAVAEQQLAARIRDRLRHFNPEHSERATKTPIEEWQVKTDLFERAAALG
jgi:hypothetical protein